MDLSAQEKELAAEIGFDEEVLLIVKEELQAEIQRLNLEIECYEEDIDKSDFSSEVVLKKFIPCSGQKATTIIVDGLFVLVDAYESREVVSRLRFRLAPQGYLPFLTGANLSFFVGADKIRLRETIDRRLAEHKKHGKPEIIAVIKGSSQYDIIKIQQTDGSNYDISNMDIINKLKDWEKISYFEIMGASDDWIDLKFAKLPEDIKDFAEDIYKFCPDTLDQATFKGFHSWNEFTEQTVENLAAYLKEEKRLFLWWD